METWNKKGSPTVIVEAIRVNEDNVIQVAKWCNGELIEEIDPFHSQEMQWGINVNSANGMERASLGMYVIKFGTHFFVKHNRPFEMMYEPTNRPAPAPQTPREARRI